MKAPGSLQLLTFSVLILAPHIVSGASGYPPFKLGFNTQIVSNGFEISRLDGTGSRLRLRPAQSNYVGAILGYRWLSGTISFAVPASEEIRALEGTSDYQDLRLSLYYRRWGIEAGYSFYRGFLLENSAILSPATLNGATYYRFPSLKTAGYGANLFYVLDPSDYSLPAAIDQSEMQKTSGGSWILLATFRRQLLKSDSAFIPTELQSQFGAEGLINSVDTSSYGAGIAYAHNWVFGSFFMAPLLGISLGYQNLNYTQEGAAGGFHSSAGANAHLRLGLGLNSRRYFLTGSIYADIYGKETETIRFSNNVYGVSFSIGTRF